MSSEPECEPCPEVIGVGTGFIIMGVFLIFFVIALVSLWLGYIQKRKELALVKAGAGVSVGLGSNQAVGFVSDLSDGPGFYVGV